MNSYKIYVWNFKIQGIYYSRTINNHIKWGTKLGITEHINAYKNTHGLSNDTFVKELYKKTNVSMSQSYIYKILSGQKSNITVEYIIALSNFLNISTDELLQIEDKTDKEDLEKKLFYYLKQNKFLNEEEKLLLAAFYNALKEKRKAIVRNVSAFMEDEVSEIKKLNKHNQ